MPSSESLPDQPKKRSLFGRKPSVVEDPTAGPDPVFDIYIEEAEWETDGYEGTLLWRGLGIRDADDEILRYEELNDAPIPALVVSAAGAAEHHAKELRDSAFEPGSRVELARDQRNKYDKHAVVLLDRFGEQQVGFVPKDFSKLVSSWVAAGDAQALVLTEIRQGRKRVGLKALIWRPSAVRILPRE